MTDIEYLRARAADLRWLANRQADPSIKQRLLDLAAECESLADKIAQGLNGDHR